MVEYELSATFKLFDEIGQGEHRVMVLLRRGPGDQGFIRLATDKPIGPGDTFQADGTVWRVIRRRDVFEGWEAEPVEQ